MKYRSKTDIIGHILEAVNGRGRDTGLTKSKIMYSVFLYYAQLQGYLSDLVDKGLIEQYQKELQEDEGKENKGKQRPSYYYRITDKGRCFLQVYRDLDEMIIV
ncbi:MAG: winged helix-turn-helix domain-containing protein [Thermoproteota archaeon]|jgi:predicted transcriptional regulator|nr:winged helix-turn-helix domain-containing protein [Thermoproteota archaeon]